MPALPCTFRFMSSLDGEPLSVNLHLKRADGSCWTPPASRVPGRRPKNLVLGPDLWAYCTMRPGAEVLYALHGEVRLELEPGTYEVFAQRGFEWEPLRASIRVARQAPNHFAFRLAPVRRARAEGWVNGDIHLHFTRASHADSAFWREIFDAHDLAMGNVMTYNHGAHHHDTPQFAYGQRGEHRHAHGVIASGEEIRDNNVFGHVTVAGLKRLIEPVSVGKLIGLRHNFPYFADFCDRVHRQGGLVGYAHGGTGGTGNWVLWHSLPVEAALGKLDFLEIIQFNSYVGYPYWYALLNCGITMPCVAGSDWPWSKPLASWFGGLGTDRTYVQTGSRTDYRAWLGGIKAGRTYASNGPLLTFHVDGQGPGARVVSKRRGVEVRAAAWAPHPLERLDVVANGQVVLYAENRGGRKTLELEGRVRLKQDGWLAARCHGSAAPRRTGGARVWDLYAHSSPTYVRVDGKGIGDPAEALRMADSVRFIREYARHAGWWKTPKQLEGYMKLCAKAIRFYERIALAAGQAR
ncbi:MAG: CehA/McbA family metallohydrolase [Planctomycetota bacterium]|nr:CehA/McbA family metallohydrolase [Planctomycetota bacterium]